MLPTQLFYAMQFVGGGDWMNMLTSGRLGMSYHGFVGNLTTEGKVALPALIGDCDASVNMAL